MCLIPFVSSFVDDFLLKKPTYGVINSLYFSTLSKTVSKQLLHKRISFPIVG
jgi:hypothetical protein